MNPFRWLFTKTSSVASLIYARTAGVRAAWTGLDYEVMAKNSYDNNAIAYKAIGLVAKSLAHIPLEVHVNQKADDKHPLYQLLKRPNPMQGGATFFESWAAFFQIAGNAYVEHIGPDNGPPLELWNLRPDRMKVIPGPMGLAGFIYETAGRKQTFPVDPITGVSTVRHFKSFSPTNDWYGQSAVQAARYAIDQHNAAGEWNFNLLKRSAAPSGAFVYGAENGSRLSDSQYEQLKKMIREKMQGAAAAGEPMIIDGGLDWKTMSFNPKDMDWINGKNTSARDIALVFGVPPQLLGIPGDNTYANYQEARRALYEETVIPLLDFLLDELNAWLSPLYGQNVRICYDEDCIPALSTKRKEKWDMVENSTFLTINEKREALGFEPFDNGEADKLWMPTSLVPMEDAAEPEGGDGEGEDSSALDGAGVDTGGKPVSSVQATALNGAQITSLLSLVTQVAEGQLPEDAAVEALLLSFPTISRTEAIAIFKPLRGFTPEKPAATETTPSAPEKP